MEKGIHLILDIILDSKNVYLWDEESLIRLSKELIESIGMKLMMGPYSQKFDGELAGVSVVSVLAESHISVHTFPEFGLVEMDIFSCVPFDTDKAKHFLSDKLEPLEMETVVIRRPLTGG